MSKPDESAFPTQMWDEELKEATWLDGGITKREFFAAMAMQGIVGADTALEQFMANLNREEMAWRGFRDFVSAMSVDVADALLAELARAEQRVETKEQQGE